MRQTTKIRRADIDKAAKHFDEAPEVEPEEVTRKDAIRILGPKIKAMFRKGYNRNKIAEMLTQHGIPMETDLLASYLRAASEVPSNSAKRTRRTSGGSAAGAGAPAGSKSPSAPAATPEASAQHVPAGARQLESSATATPRAPAKSRTDTGGG
jgi:hypothetical protein